MNSRKFLHRQFSSHHHRKITPFPGLSCWIFFPAICASLKQPWVPLSVPPHRSLQSMSIYMGLLNNLIPGAHFTRERDVECCRRVLAAALKVGLFREAGWHRGSSTKTQCIWLIQPCMETSVYLAWLGKRPAHTSCILQCVPNMQCKKPFIVSSTVKATSCSKQHVIVIHQCAKNSACTELSKRVCCSMSLLAWAIDHTGTPRAVFKKSGWQQILPKIVVFGLFQGWKMSKSSKLSCCVEFLPLRFIKSNCRNEQRGVRSQDSAFMWASVFWFRPKN